MDYLHYEFNAGPDEVLEVDLDRQANVLLLDESNYQSYRRGSSFRYYGGWVKTSPYRISPPRHDRWHVVIDMGGAAGTIRAAARLVG